MQHSKHRLTPIILDKSWLRFHQIQPASAVTHVHMTNYANATDTSRWNSGYMCSQWNIPVCGLAVGSTKHSRHRSASFFRRSIRSVRRVTPSSSRPATRFRRCCCRATTPRRWTSRCSFYDSSCKADLAARCSSEGAVQFQRGIKFRNFASFTDY